MPYLGKTTPYYGGGQVPNPANVYQVQEVPTLQATPGSLAVIPNLDEAFIAMGTTNGRTNWRQLSATVVDGGYPISPYVVGPAGQAGYQTIQSAVDAAAAVGGGVVFIQEGTYLENIMLPFGVSLVGVTASDNGDNVVIQGYIQIVAPVVGTATEVGIQRVNIAPTNSGGCIRSSVTTIDGMLVEISDVNASFSSTEFFINFSRASGTFICTNVYAPNFGFFNSTTNANAALYIDNCQSVGGGSSNPTSAGFRNLFIYNSNVGDNISTISGALVRCTNSTFAGTHTLAATVNSNYFSCNWLSPTTCVINNTGGVVRMSMCTFSASSGNSLGGTGTFYLDSCSWTNFVLLANTATYSSQGATFNGQVYSSYDMTTGLAGTISLCNTSDLTTAGGVGAIRMSSANDAPSAGWIKIYVETTPYWIPVWTTNSP